jgi:tetratricopeptide (TPR) repeat protein
MAVFSKLTEDYPELPEPYNNLAVLYAQQKQYDKARTALEMAIRIHPGYALPTTTSVMSTPCSPVRLMTRRCNSIRRGG